MLWLHRLQQRLSITKNEALTLLSLSLFLLLGTAGRHACRQMRPVSADYYAEMDSLFAARSAAGLDSEVDAVRDSRQTDERGSSVLHPQADSLGEGPSESHVDEQTPLLSGALQTLPIDLNRAAAQELEQLPRVGPKIAERIIAFRNAYGSFRTVDDLLSVAGIGPKTLELIRPHVVVRVQPPSEDQSSGAQATMEPSNLGQADRDTIDSVQ